VADCVFFYGTLMTGFDRRRRLGVESKMTYRGRGWIHASLFDLGIYPAAVPDPEGRVWGETYEMHDPRAVLGALDEVEGYRPEDPDRSLYTRSKTDVTFEDGKRELAWAYFYNAPLGGAQRINSGDYLEHVKVR
jgi:gamma-glutamylcyclotransferase (GGCT)/AIG2-like uncharacterized protein YtfP